MKKIVSLLAATAAVCALSVNAFAADINANEQAVLDTISATAIAGQTVSADIVTTAENYFLGDAVDVTAEQAAAFQTAYASFVAFCDANGLDKVGALVASGNTIDVSALSAYSVDTKAALVDFAADVCESIGLNFSYDPIKKIGVVADASGNKVAELSHAIKQTGGYGYVAGVSAALLSLVALSVVTAKKKGLVK